ncbi:hypothetical protein ACFWSF_12790 [Streptomyces sp. NPDC058611]|uniref:hypothetical protein n=1 Tax=unclassified Streptomyces TaxID=2593676 RepID=UPI00365FEEF2
MRPDLPRPFRLRAAWFLCPPPFVLRAGALYWSRWPDPGTVTALPPPAVPIAALAPLAA